MARFAHALLVPAALSSLASGQELLHEKSGLLPGDMFGVALDTLGDLDLDGYDDFIIGASYAKNGYGRAHVYSGRSGDALFVLTPDVHGTHFGQGAAGVGDVDLDGVPDFCVGAPLKSKGTLTIHSGVDAAVIHEVQGAFAGGLFGYDADGVGDVDGDGRPDVVVSAPSEGTVYLISGLDGATLWTSGGYVGAGVNFRLVVRGAGDVDSDGVPDVIVGEPFFGATNRGRAHVLSGADGSVVRQWTGLPNTMLGFAVDGYRDVDGDSHADVLVGISHEFHGGYAAGEARVYSGGDGSILWAKAGPPGQSATFGRAVAAAGDVNGDGLEDFLVGAPYFDGGLGRAYLIDARGPVLARFEGNPGDDMPEMGYFVSGAGDVNRDGLADVLVSAPGEDDDRGAASVFAGNDLFLLPSAAEALVGDTLTFHVAGGPSAAPFAVVLETVDGAPATRLVGAGQLDPAGAGSVELTLGVATQGRSLVFRAYALVPGGRADSVARAVEVQ